MHRWLLDHLVCPPCQKPLELAAESEENGQVMTGELTCPSCAKKYPIRKGIPRFVDSDKYCDTFSFQRRAVRKHWDYYNTEDSATRLFPEVSPLPIEEYKNGVMLEAGCGYGRWVRFFSGHGARVIGVDLSTDSIELCASEYLKRENVGLVQADLFNLPFPKNHFDKIFSFGVLMCTPDCPGALANLIEHLKPKGIINLYVYGTDKMVDAYRKVAAKLPLWLLYGLLWFHNYFIMSWMRHLGPIKTIYHRFIPASGAKEAWHRVHDDFDRYSPVYAVRYPYPEVYQWFRYLGMEDIHLTKARIAVTATKPGADGG